MMRACLLAGLLAVGAARALTPEAKEFLEISQKLEPVQCQKRQLRRATSRKARASASETDRRPATSGDKLAHRAMAGDPIQAITNGAATGQTSFPAHQTTIAATMPMATPPLICR